MEWLASFASLKLKMPDLAKNEIHIVLVNAVIIKDSRVLVAQRDFEESHMPGKWTIPGGKVPQAKGQAWNIIEKTLKEEVKEEVGIEIEDEIKLVSNSTFIRSTGHHVISLVFLCKYKSGKPKPLEDTIAVKWIGQNELDKKDFCPGVKEYIKKGFEAKKDES